MKVLILGINGFIGHSLTRAILERTDWEIVGMDLAADNLEESIGNPRLTFSQADLSEQMAWVEQQVDRCDVVLPLVAIPTPMSYIREPLRVFDVTFDLNLKIVRLCAQYGTRVVFPGSSEVYGMCEDEEFDEGESRLVLGPVRNHRWIYACAKQMLERVVLAYAHTGDLEFTLFRPFNWIGPRLDGPRTSSEGGSRVVTQFISDLCRVAPLRLVDGGRQTRCLTYIDDGIDCLLSILENRDGNCDGKIFNIGNPANECSIEQLAHQLKRLFMNHPEHRYDPEYSEIAVVSSQEHYGDGYEDTPHRRPSIARARRILGWEPRVGLDEALEKTLHAYLEAITPVRA